MKIKYIDQIIIGFVAFSITLFIIAAGNIVFILLSQSPKTTPRQVTSNTSGNTDQNKNSIKKPKDLIHLNFQNSSIVSSKISSDKIALTFDDGPDYYFTERILQTLKDYNAKATFFVTGLKVSQRCSLLKDIYQAGHEIGNHSYSHPYLTEMSFREQLKEIEETNKTIQACIREPNYQVKWFRPPFGRSNSETKLVLDKLELNSALWTIDTDDWKKSNDRLDILNSLALSQGQDIILMHDGVIELPTDPNQVPLVIRNRLTTLREQFSYNREATVDALRMFLEGQANRYQFVTLSEAFKLNKKKGGITRTSDRGSKEQE